jgi:RNA polymerase sigma factor (sigma-70 family)
MTQPFEQVVREHGTVILRVCRALVGSADAEDVWSETFLAALRTYPDLRPGSNVRGWLVTIAHHKAIDMIRKAKRTPLADGEAPDQPTWDSTSTPDADLLAVLDTLAPKQRGAVIYRYLADMSYADIAVLLGGSQAAARRSAADGIAVLRRRYLKETTS